MKAMACTRLIKAALIVVVVLAFQVEAQHQEAVAQDQALTVLITGSNRDYGLEFVRAYAERGWRVIATCRTPSKAEDLKALAVEYPNIVIEELDIIDYDEVDAVAEKYRDTPIDVLLNNAAINPFPLGPIAQFGSFDYEQFKRVLITNIIGPLKVSEAFVEHVAASNQKKIVVMTSNGGSIGRAREGGAHDYRASKAGINMAMRLLALELRERGIVVGIIAPGSIDTAGYLDADPETLPPRIQDALPRIKETWPRPEEAMDKLINLLDELTLETSGVFYDIHGEEWPW